ncbi:MAG: 2Fe-2S iron-sulfur cluster-binding protein, partial [Planctomycetota bacterium]
MIRLKIDGHPIDAPEGSTILEAARLAGIDIPTMCHLDGRPARTSCMVCVVKVEGTRGMVP